MRATLRGQQRSQAVARETLRERPGPALRCLAQQQQPQVRSRREAVAERAQQRLAPGADRLEIIEDQEHGLGGGAGLGKQCLQRHARTARHVEGPRHRRVPPLVTHEPELVARHRPRQAGGREALDPQPRACEMQRQVECERRLAAAGRPGEQHGALGGHDLDGREMIGRARRAGIGELSQPLRLHVLARGVDQQRQEAVAAGERVQLRAGQAQQDVGRARREIGAQPCEGGVDHAPAPNRDATCGSRKRWISIA